MNDLHGIILAYRSSHHLGELTRFRNTCSLPFGGRYRLIDFSLSSFLNAGITDVGVIVHESYQSLLDHVGTGKDWDLSRRNGGLRILPPFGYAQRGMGEYRGTMEALAGVVSYLSNIRQDYVVLTRGDVATNLPLSDIFAKHKESGADITVVCVPHKPDRTCQVDYITVDETNRITDVSVNCAAPVSELESCETYILSKQLLLSMVEYCDAHNQYSFTRDVLLPRLQKLHVSAYIHGGYFARFHSTSGYFNHSMELLDPAVRNDLFDPNRPIRTRVMSTASTYYGPSANSLNSLISDGCLIDGVVENCIIGRNVVIEEGAVVKNSVIMEGAVIQSGASLAYAIADRYVRINSDRVLMGHQNYPLAIAKNSIV